MQFIIGTSLFFLGAVLASFIGVITERVYTGQSWWRGRSRCNSCRRKLSSLDLIPVLSWVFSLGRCRTCKAKVPFLYVTSELFLGILFVLAYFNLGLNFKLFVFILVLLSLLFVVLYDLRHTIVPWSGTFLLFLFSLLFLLMETKALRSLEMIGGVAALIGVFFLLITFFSKGKAMGLGDAPVAFSLSLLAGSWAVSGLLFSFWIGAAVGIVILCLRRGGPTMGIEVPFVPFLAAGYLLAFFVHWNPFI